jgi:hypothetical protein
MMNTNLLEDDVVGKIYLADNIDVLRTLPSESVDLIYIDPPFNTGKVQERTQLRTVRSEHGDRVGFQGHRYESIVVGKKRFADLFDDYLAFLGTASCRGAPYSGAAWVPLRSPGLPRGALLQGAAGCHLRPRLLFERDYLGL